MYQISVNLENFRFCETKFAQRKYECELPVGWSINISEFTYMKKYDNIHDLLELEIVVDLNLAFKTQTFALFVPPDHDIYTIYKKLVKNFTLSNLTKVLSSAKLCTDVEKVIAKRPSTQHTVPHNTKHCSDRLNKPNIYFQSDL